jgi:hypothetical protein
MPPANPPAPSPKLGLKPWTPSDSDFKWEDVSGNVSINLDAASPLPSLPTSFGASNLLPAHQWLSLGNHEYGDCFWAGAAHEHMGWEASAGRTATFTTAGVLGDYSAVTGFNPHAPDVHGSNPTDGGTDVREGFEYRRTTGIVDGAGNRHKIGAYLLLPQGNWHAFLEALYICEAVGLVINDFPQSAVDQFEKGKPWSTPTSGPLGEGHYVCANGRYGYTKVVSWGRCFDVTQPFLMDGPVSAMYAIVSTDMLKGGVSAHGLDIAQVNADLARLT